MSTTDEQDDVLSEESLEAFRKIGRSRAYYEALARQPSAAHDPTGDGLRADGPDDLGRQQARLDAHSFRTTWDAHGNELRDQPSTLAGRDAKLVARARTGRPDEQLLADPARVIRGSFTNFDPRDAGRRLGARSWEQPERANEVDLEATAEGRDRPDPMKQLVQGARRATVDDARRIGQGPISPYEDPDDILHERRQLGQT